MLTRPLPFTLWQFLCFLLVVFVTVAASGCANTAKPFVACQISTGQAFVAQTGTTFAGLTPGAGFYLPEVDVMCPQPAVIARPFIPAVAASAAKGATP